MSSWLFPGLRHKDSTTGVHSDDDVQTPVWTFGDSPSVRGDTPALYPFVLPSLMIKYIVPVPFRRPVLPRISGLFSSSLYTLRDPSCLPLTCRVFPPHERPNLLVVPPVTPTSPRYPAPPRPLHQTPYALPTFSVPSDTFWNESETHLVLGNLPVHTTL